MSVTVADGLSRAFGASQGAAVELVPEIDADAVQGYVRGLEKRFSYPAKDAELYRERSPLTHASKIRAPLLILQGENDPRVPRSEAEQVVKALRDGGKTYDYHVYPGEGHGFRVTENRIDSLRRALDWFERHLRQA